MPTAVMDWKAYSDEQPVLGSRCLIALNGRDPSGAVIDCEYHTLETFQMEYELDFDPTEVSDEFKKPFFVETDNHNEWWEAKYVHHWAELFAPPSREGSGQ